jgi:hypothetical protein
LREVEYVIVSSINSYLSSGYPCLHLRELEEGIDFGSLRDSPTAMVTVYYHQYTHDEMDLLKNYPLEIGILKNNNLFTLVFKLGPDSNPFIFDFPFDPNSPDSFEVIDKWINSSLFTMAIVEDEPVKERKYNVPVFRFFRVLSIPVEIQLYVAEFFTKATEMGGEYSIKYFDWIESKVRYLNPEERWNLAEKLGQFED